MSAAAAPAPVPSAQTIALLYPGAMGHALGRVLGERGHRVVTWLGERGPGSAGRAAAAGIAERPTLEAAVTEADLVLSVLPPATALGLAERVAAVLRGRPRPPLYADCNAVAPATMARIAATLDAAGVPVVDAAIFGPPPGVGAPRIYACGEQAPRLAAAFGEAVPVVVLPGGLGRASALKMCYAALTKGSWALYAALLVAARGHGVLDELLAETARARPFSHQEMQRMVPRLPADAARWIGEMEEIAAAFAAGGSPTGFPDAAAEVFRWLAAASPVEGADEAAVRGATAAFAAASLPRAS